jgi:hypothetical protein
MTIIEVLQAKPKYIRRTCWGLLTLRVEANGLYWDCLPRYISCNTTSTNISGQLFKPYPVELTADDWKIVDKDE